LRSDGQFRENRRSENHTSLRDVNESVSAFFTFLSDLSEIRYDRCARNVADHCECRKSRRREGHKLHTGVNKISFTRVKCIVPYSESKQCLGKVNVLRHGVHHLQSCCNIYEYELQLHLHCIFLYVSYNYEHASNSQQNKLHILQQCHVTVAC